RTRSRTIPGPQSQTCRSRALAGNPGRQAIAVTSRNGDKQRPCHPLPAPHSPGITAESFPNRREPSMNSLILTVALLAPTQQPAPAENDVGVLPVGADGKPLNLDFETGTLKDWTAEGDAF